jgi:hypothetical protein
MHVTRKTVTLFGVERTLPGRECKCDPSDSGPCFCLTEPHDQRRWFRSLRAAYLWKARASLFRARAERCSCDRERAYDGDGIQCELCNETKWRPVVERLARLMRAHDERVTREQQGDG